SFLQILARAFATGIVLMVMGFSLAGAARLLGDRGVAYDGKLTLNPLVHIDIFAFLAGIAGRVGWVRHIPIDPEKCRGGRLGPVLVAIAAMIAALDFARPTLYALPWDTSPLAASRPR